MIEWHGLQWLLWEALGLAVAVLAAIGVALVKLRLSLTRRAGGATAKRTWHAETVDPVARLRSPYKAEPLCPRCLAVGAPGERPFFVCRLNDHCGLLEDEPVARR